MLLRKRQRIQVGRGIGSILSVFWNAIAPFAKQLFKWGRKALSSGTAKEIGKNVASTALEKGVSAITDAMSGEPIRDTVKKNLKEAGSDILASGITEVSKTVEKKQAKKQAKKRAASEAPNEKKKKAPKLKPSFLLDIFSEQDATS